MSKTKMALAALMALASVAAQAQSQLFVLGQAWDFESTTAAAYNPGTPNPDFPMENILVGVPLTTNGLVSVSAGGGTATVSAVADPTTGMFKSFAQVAVSGPLVAATATATIAYDLVDAVTFTGPDSTVSLSFTINRDTLVSQQTAVVGNPDLSYGDLAGQFFTSSQRFAIDQSAASPFVSDFPQPRGTYGQFGYTLARDGVAQRDPLGRYTSEEVVHFEATVGETYYIHYQVVSTVECFAVVSCGMTVDASHSDYIGMTLMTEGASYNSAQGYQYLGLAAAVPEPSSWALSLLGAGLLAARTRRRSA